MPVQTDIQQITIIKALLQKPRTTMDLKAMHILNPTPRVAELRQQGFFIATFESDYIDGDGELHTIGKYVLFPERNDLNKKGQVIAERAARF